LDDDDVDAVRRELEAQRVGQPFHGELGRVVPAPDRLVDAAADGGDVHDASATERAHRREHQLRQTRQAEHVHLELATRLLDRDVLEGTVRAVSGVVDEHVDASLLVHDPIDARLHRGVVGDVHLEHLAPGCREVRHPVHPTRSGVDHPAARDQREGGCVADSGGRAGDEDDGAGLV